MPEFLHQKLFRLTLFCLTAVIACPIAYTANCTVDSIGAIPINEFSRIMYFGLYEGGLYSRGTNIIPQLHAAEGQARIAQIQPRDITGAPDPDGNFVLLSVGMSNAVQEFDNFLRDAIDHPAVDLSVWSSSTVPQAGRLRQLGSHRTPKTTTAYATGCCYPKVSLKSKCRRYG